MARARKIQPDEKSSPPAASIEARENQLILLATNLAEKQLREGTASSQVIAHYLKLGSTRERLEQERIRYENELAGAKTAKIQSDRRSEELFQEAIAAMRSYRGIDEEGEEDYYED